MDYLATGFACVGLPCDQSPTVILAVRSFRKPLLRIFCGKLLAIRKSRIAKSESPILVGRGFFDMARLEEIHGRFRELLLAEGVELGGIYTLRGRE